MAYWNSRGLRGSALEDKINMTNERYKQKGIALIQKIPTPIKPIKIDQEKRVITLAYFEQKSTVDYIGVAQGIPICFDAKETALKSLPLANVHAHQVEFMKAFKEQGGEAFLIVYFKKYDEHYLIDIDTLDFYYNKALKGGKMSVPYEAFDKNYLIPVENGMFLNYLKVVDLYLRNRQQQGNEQNKSNE